MQEKSVFFGILDFLRVESLSSAKLSIKQVLYPRILVHYKISQAIVCKGGIIQYIEPT